MEGVDEEQEIIRIANEIKSLIQENKDVTLEHFESWFGQLLNKYSKEKAINIIDRAVLRFVVLWREEKSKQYATNIQQAKA